MTHTDSHSFIRSPFVDGKPPLDSPLPSNVYRLPQKDFAAIPGSPWVYWVPPTVRKLFESLTPMGEYSPSIHGTGTYDNFRFLRFWWETGIGNIAFGCKSWQEYERSNKDYVPYMKGGSFKRWYGNQEYILALTNMGRTLVQFLDEKRDAIRGKDCIFRVGITYSFLTAAKFNARISPGGFIFDVAGSSLFPENVPLLLSILNSQFAGYILKLINPTVNFQVGDLARIPVPQKSSRKAEEYVAITTQLSRCLSSRDETTYDYAVPQCWKNGLEDQAQTAQKLRQLESQIDNEVYALYGISPEDRAAIESELAGGQMIDDEVDNDEAQTTADEETSVSGLSSSVQELAIRWISYAVGIVLGRFQPGVAGSLGSAIYRRSDFAIGSLLAPDEAEFDELVGPAPTPAGGRGESPFAYIDADGGRHVFPANVEKALQALALPDGIAVLDEDNPRDLARLVEQALVWMLGEQGAAEVIQTIDEGQRTKDGGRKTNGVRPPSIVLRQFLEKDFFTAWHFKWYRKRPVYWPIQSSKRSYGFVLFHEKIDRQTFYTIQREPYLDTRRNAVALKIADLQSTLARTTGASRKKAEKELDELHKLSDELAAFAKDLEAITLGGYEPDANWIDDGVILRMAPLWKVIPIWKSEPKKYWERLEAGDFDWSHIAMHYWPARVKEKCKMNKSFAIAHGMDEGRKT